ANPAPEIVRTLYKAGASFDVASLPEFLLVHENIRRLPARARQDFIWDKIIYANPIKPKETLQALDEYKPLITYDNLEELRKIKRFAPHAGLVLRLRVPNTGSMVELSSKFGCDTGEAAELIAEAFRLGLVVEGRIIGKASRDGKTCYYIDDSVYHTFSGIIFDHCQYRVKAMKGGEREMCTVFGQTCDGMDAIVQSEELPRLEIEDLVYSEQIGGDSDASS